MSNFCNFFPSQFGVVVFLAASRSTEMPTVPDSVPCIVFVRSKVKVIGVYTCRISSPGTTMKHSEPIRNRAAIDNPTGPVRGHPTISQCIPPQLAVSAMPISDGPGPKPTRFSFSDFGPESSFKSVRKTLRTKVLGGNPFHSIHHARLDYRSSGLSNYGKSAKTSPVLDRYPVCNRGVSCCGVRPLAL